MVDLIVRFSPGATEAQPIIDGLVAESALRYGTDRPGGARAEVERYADRVTDFVCTTMCGLSAKARAGHSLDQLMATAHLASVALTHDLPA